MVDVNALCNNGRKYVVFGFVVNSVFLVLIVTSEIDEFVAFSALVAFDTTAFKVFVFGL